MNLLAAIIIIFLTCAVSVLGSAFTGPEIQTWYAQLNLPSWTPPGGTIGIVWTIIFILTAMSAILVWNRAQQYKYISWIGFLFFLNGILNVFWSFLFFNQHAIGLSVIEMLILNASTIALIVLIVPVNRFAAMLLFPYVAWVSFATYLAYSVWKLNG
ncbi:MAG: TspO/MBR family protein [Patescibacteria group bacterium]